MLCDTTVVSDLFIDDADRRRTRGMGLDDAQLLMSLMTRAEMLYGAHARAWGPERMQRLEHHFRTFVPDGIDERTSEIYAEILLACRRKGREKTTWNDCIDMWIAATAIRFNWPLAALDDAFDDVPRLRRILPDGSEATNA